MAQSSSSLLFFGTLFSVSCRAFGEVSCRLGQSCVLPCSFQGQLKMVLWTRLPGDFNVHVYVEDKDVLTNQLPLYAGRTSLSEDLSRGNASLILSEVRVQDQGRYRCFIISREGQHSRNLELRVFAPVLEVSLQQEAEQLLCRSEGLFPKPSVSWTPSSLQHNTSVSESETGLFTIISSVTLLDSEDKYVCNISTEHDWRTADLQVKEKEILIDVPSTYQEGHYSCLQNTDTGSVIMRVVIKRNSLALEIFLVVLCCIFPCSFFVLLYLYIHMRTFEQKNKRLLREIKRLMTPVQPPEGGTEQNLSQNVQDGDDQPTRSAERSSPNEDVDTPNSLELSEVNSNAHPVCEEETLLPRGSLEMEQRV